MVTLLTFFCDSEHIAFSDWKGRQVYFYCKAAEPWLKCFFVYNSTAHEVCGWGLSRHHPHLYDREELHGPQTLRHGDIRQPWQTWIWWEELNVSPSCAQAELKPQMKTSLDQSSPCSSCYSELSCLEAQFNKVWPFYDLTRKAIPEQEPLVKTNILISFELISRLLGLCFDVS